MRDKFRVAGLVSASASTAAAVCEACQDDRLNAEMPLVIANTPTAGEKLRALKHPPEIVVISRRDFDSRLAFGEAILKVLDQYRIDFIGQWGWDPLTPDNVLEKFRRRITNQHPDLTPDFGGRGMNGIVAVCARLNFARAVNREMGVEPVSHWATEVLDGGDVVQKGYVEIFPDDTCESLYERVKLEEHRVQIATVAAAISGQLSEIEIHSPVHEDESSILATAKTEALKHHSEQTQSQQKLTKI